MMAPEKECAHGIMMRAPAGEEEERHCCWCQIAGESRRLVTDPFDAFPFFFCPLSPLAGPNRSHRRHRPARGEGRRWLGADGDRTAEHAGKQLRWLHAAKGREMFTLLRARLARSSTPLHLTSAIRFGGHVRQPACLDKHGVDS